MWHHTKESDENGSTDSYQVFYQHKIKGKSIQLILISKYSQLKCPSGPIHNLYKSGMLRLMLSNRLMGNTQTKTLAFKNKKNYIKWKLN